MNNTIKGIIIITFIFLSIQSLKAQRDFRSGYIISNSGDTLQGQIDYRGDELMGSVCKFRKSKADNIHEYLPAEISSYRFTDSKYYVSKEVMIEGKSRKVFLEFLINAKVKVYYLLEKGNEHFYLEKDGLRFMEIPYTEKLVNESGRSYLHKSTKHIGVLKIFFSEAPNVQKDIDNSMFMDRRSLIKIAEKYHKSICKDSVCIVYEKNISFIKINIELTAGTVNYSNIARLDDNSHNTFHDISYFQKGALFHIWLPWASEKLYLRTGVLHSNLKFKSGSLAVLKIPVHLEYYYDSKKLISPRLSYGLNFSGYYKSSVSFMGGLNIKITKTVKLSLTTEAEFTNKGLFFPETFLAHSVLGGVYFDI